MQWNMMALLHNTSRSTWHPIWFRWAPLPGESKVPRYRSQGHHTGGFTTRQAALDHIQHEMRPKLPDLLVIVDGDIEWDGGSAPAMTVLVADGKIV